MIEIKTFAQVREITGEASVSLAIEQAQMTVADIKTVLKARSSSWQDVLDDGVLCAVNQVLCDDSQPISDGDEVAFFPPVTGG
ncbi:molybdopterin converting factor subunit 1 [Alteromonas sp. 14N.309.X.WAT.G.H12]|uniref:molybdopterin converting factor subunit 1 n=1 Tax=Alteromonas sp. 14N.309.X.WAT.G.H12 TaxID=3120824 RepID=UPI002FD0D48B